MVAFLINTNPDEIRNSKLIAHGMRNGKKLVSELNKKYPDRKMYEKKLIKELKKKGIKIGETYYSDWYILQEKLISDSIKYEL